MTQDRSSRNGSGKQSSESPQRVPLLMQPLRWLPGESRSEFAERALLEIKRGLAERILMQEEGPD